MTLQRLKSKLAEVNKVLESIQDPEPKIINSALDVFPGDVWFYPPNNKVTNRPFYYTVKSVNKKKDRVEFTYGWNPYKDMLNGQWVLVARPLRKHLQRKVESL